MSKNQCKWDGTLAVPVDQLPILPLVVAVKLCEVAIRKLKAKGRKIQHGYKKITGQCNINNKCCYCTGKC